jgi:ribosomal protein L29
MDFNKLSSKDIRSLDKQKVADAATALRKELVTMRMDVYNAGPQAKSKARNMRKTLARLLTVSTEKKMPAAAKPAVKTETKKTKK